MPLKQESRKKSESKVKIEKSTSGRVRAGGEKSGGSVEAARPPVTSAQLDAKQSAIKARRKAPGPPRKTRSNADVSPSDVPPVEPLSK
jgi:hypothetical protein